VRFARFCDKTRAGPTRVSRQQTAHRRQLEEQGGKPTAVRPGRHFSTSSNTQGEKRFPPRQPRRRGPLFRGDLLHVGHGLSPFADPRTDGIGDTRLVINPQGRTPSPPSQHSGGATPKHHLALRFQTEARRPPAAPRPGHRAGPRPTWGGAGGGCGSIDWGGWSGKEWP